MSLAILRFNDLEEYGLHTKLIGMGSADPNRFFGAINTYDLENATPSDYLREKKELESSINYFGKR